MFRGVEHGQADTFHAVAHRLGLIGLLIAERIKALLATRQFVGIHIRRGLHGHDQLDDFPVLIDGGGQIDILDIALETNGSERLQDDRIVIVLVSRIIRAIEITGFTIDRYRTGDEAIVVVAVDFDPDIRSLRADLLLRLRPLGATRPLSLKNAACTSSVLAPSAYT